MPLVVAVLITITFFLMYILNYNILIKLNNLDILKKVKIW